LSWKYEAARYAWVADRQRLAAARMAHRYQTSLVVHRSLRCFILRLIPESVGDRQRIQAVLRPPVALTSRPVNAIRGR
jgi:hypothetical protein